MLMLKRFLANSSDSHGRFTNSAHLPVGEVFNEKGGIRIIFVFETFVAFPTFPQL